MWLFMNLNIVNMQWNSWRYNTFKAHSSEFPLNEFDWLRVMLDMRPLLESTHTILASLFEIDIKFSETFWNPA